MPFGKYRGVRLKLIPDGYLSWLTTLDLNGKFWWIKESLLAELRFRGLRADLADVPDEQPVEQRKVIPIDRPRPRRAYHLNEA
jgi:uncharacterized protein (DUF3820 family)